MQALIYWPATTRKRCLDERDLARLGRNYHVIAPETDSVQDLLDNWSTWMRQTQVLVTGWNTPPITPEMLESAPHLRFIMHAAGSIKGLVPSDAWIRNIRVASCNDALGQMVAETTLGIIICALKGVFPANLLTHAGQWKVGDFSTPGFQVKELFDVTIGIIGAGRTGRHLIRLLEPFEVDIVVADPLLTADEAQRLGVRRLDLDKLMAVSDVVTLHAPALPETHHMLSTRQFKAMRDGAIFINTARGSIVDEAALAAELLTGRIWAYIDVTDPEPPMRDHPFRQLPNVVLTPHIAGAIFNGCRRLGRSAVDQLIQFANGHTISGEVTVDRLPALA